MKVCSGDNYSVIDLIILFIASIGLFLFQYIPPKNMMSKRNGAMYLAGYIAYMISLFIN